MKHVGIFEAKTHLSSLVEEVEKGGEIIITRHGRPVARLVRSEDPHTPDKIARRRAAIKRIRQIASELKIKATHEEIKGWINEGRH
jgi:prevent-host-death family protein